MKYQMRISKPSHSPEQADFVKDFIQRPGKRFIYGRTDEGASIAKEITVDGFIDDFTKEKTFLGLPCVKLGDVPADARIVSTVVQAHAISVIKKLRNHNLNHVDYFAFKALSNLSLPEIPYWVGAKKHFEANKKSYEDVYNALCDMQSRDIFERIMNFRLNYDLREMEIFTANLKGMYFESFLNMPEQGAVFFDVGSYDGYNSEHFYQLYPEMGKAYLFEPIPEQADFLSQKYKDHPKFEVLDIACSDEDGEVKFAVNSTASKLSKDDSGISVKTTRLDSFCEHCKHHPDFIKMDIEGAEIKALQGAKQTISKYKPNLAISVYHDVSHLTQAYKIISEIYPTYDFYLRHYTEGYTETVLFAIPPARN